jgi:hypothetical protein
VGCSQDVLVAVRRNVHNSGNHPAYERGAGVVHVLMAGPERLT